MLSDDTIADVVLALLDDGPKDETELARRSRRNARAVYRALRILEGEGRAYIDGYRRSPHGPTGIAIWSRGQSLATVRHLHPQRDRPFAIPRS